MGLLQAANFTANNNEALVLPGSFMNRAKGYLKLPSLIPSERVEQQSPHA